MKTPGEVTNLEDKIKKLQKHQAFTLELAANSGRVREIEQLGAQLVPDEQVEKQLKQLQDDWKQLEEATEQRGENYNATHKTNLHTHICPYAHTLHYYYMAVKAQLYRSDLNSTLHHLF